MDHNDSNGGKTPCRACFASPDNVASLSVNAEQKDELRDQPIAVFDSGLGGLTVVRELLRVMPGEDILYLGDTARVPYGIKSLETVRRFSFEIASYLLVCCPKMLVVACNTASAAAVEELEKRCPVDVVDVIRPGAAAAIAACKGDIGVIATEATIGSGAYVRAIHALDPKRPPDRRRSGAPMAPSTWRWRLPEAGSACIRG